jgi:hypothetical protein
MFTMSVLKWRRRSFQPKDSPEWVVKNQCRLKLDM